MCLHLSGVKLLLPAFNNSAANRKTEKNQTDQLTDSKDLRLQRPLTSKQSNPGMQGHNKPAYRLPNRSASPRGSRAMRRARESLTTGLLKLQLLDLGENEKVWYMCKTSSHGGKF